MINQKLLVRIDERQKKMADDLRELKKHFGNVVTNNDDYKDMKNKVYKMWDDRNKALGWMVGAGLVGGTTGAVLKQLFTGVFAIIR